jgi:hypothetical protein
MIDEILDKAAIVSKLVAVHKRPILFAERSLPLDDCDSGWQFLSNEHDCLQMSDGQVWSLKEVIDIEPRLSAFITMGVGFKIVRANSEDDWRII